MWALEYLPEVKLYFLDNYPYTFPLLIRIEELKFYPDAVPPEGCTQIETNLYRWEVLEHYVFFRRQGTTLVIAAVKPIE